MQEYSTPLLCELATIVSGDLEEAVRNTVVDTWEETLALILTYAKEQEFVSLCQQLSDHMEKLGDRDAALLCSICAVDVGSLLRLGLGRSSDYGVRSHLSMMEALLILCSMVAPQDLMLSQEVATVGAKLAALCVELKDQGMESVTRFLQSLRNVPSAQPLLQVIVSMAPELLPGYVAPQPAPQTVSAQPTSASALFSGPRTAQPALAPQSVQQSHTQQTFTQSVQQSFTQPTQPAFTSSAPKPFMPSMAAPIQPAPAQPMMPSSSVERQRPAPFLPVTPVVVPQSLKPAVPEPAPEPEPEVEYE